MDSSRFDHLVRNLASLGAPRRTLVGLLGGLLLPLTGEDTDAKNGRAQQRRRQDRQDRQRGDNLGSEKKRKKKKKKVSPPVTPPAPPPPPPPPGCTPDNAAACAGRECGAAITNCDTPVNCGVRNGACPAGEACTAFGQCVCAPNNAAACTGRECGAGINNCGGTVNCGPLAGACPAGKACNSSGQCVCVPDNPAACAGRECGTAVNNCGETVNCGGACPAREKCDQPSGQCVPAFAACPSNMCGVESTCPTNCYCAQSVDGGAFCYVPEVLEPMCTVPCTSDANCNGGICVTGACCSGQPTCLARVNLTLCAP